MYNLQLSSCSTRHKSLTNGSINWIIWAQVKADVEDSKKEVIDKTDKLGKQQVETIEIPEGKDS